MTFIGSFSVSFKALYFGSIASKSPVTGVEYGVNIHTLRLDTYKGGPDNISFVLFYTQSGSSLLISFVSSDTQPGWLIYWA